MANILPYMIVFFILFIAFLIILSWTLSVYNKVRACQVDPNFWCDDSFTCLTPCTEQNTPPEGVSDCFKNISREGGLASCLFGPNQLGSTRCYNPPANQGLACLCPVQMEGIQNCLSNCTQGLDGDAPPASCCCTDSDNPRCAPDSPDCAVN